MHCPLVFYYLSSKHQQKFGKELLAADDLSTDMQRILPRHTQTHGIRWDAKSTDTFPRENSLSHTTSIKIKLWN